jgi:hypothetical protein
VSGRKPFGPRYVHLRNKELESKEIENSDLLTMLFPNFD